VQTRATQENLIHRDLRLGGWRLRLRFREDTAKPCMHPAGAHVSLFETYAAVVLSVRKYELRLEVTKE
jgi:hypothetical protein